MFAALSTALSALNGQSTAIDVIGNNLANLNTTGFKASSVAFHDLVAESLGTSQTQVGFGIGRPLTLRHFSQGAIETSTSPLACAIQGDGFLIVKDSNNNTLYTRDGNLQIDKDGTLKTATGQRIQGWTGLSGNVNVNGPVGDINIPAGSLKSPVATTDVTLDINLNSSATAGTPGGTFTTSLDVFDSLGTSQTLTFTFTKSATPNAWDYAVTSPNGTVAVTPATGTLQFDSSGNLQTPSATTAAPIIGITGLTNGASDMNITWNLFDSGLGEITQFAQTSALSANTQNGSASSELTNVTMGDNGAVIARYSNGQQSVVGQLATASILNPESLVSVGNNEFQTSAQSAAPAIGLPGTGQRGTLLGGSLEASVVDIAKEFTSLILLQRGYQANAKIITTVDDMSQQTINMKRD